MGKVEEIKQLLADRRLERRDGYEFDNDLGEAMEWLIEEVERLQRMLESMVTSTGLYRVVGEGSYLEDGLIQKLQSWGIKDTEIVIAQLKKSGRWSDGKKRVLAVK